MCLIRELSESAEEANGDALAHQLGCLVVNHLRQKIEELRNLFVAASPVLAAERIDGQVRDADLDCVLEDGTLRLCSSNMSCQLVEVLDSCPAAIPIHDDGDMARSAFGGRGAVHQRLRVSRPPNVGVGHPSRTSRSFAAVNLSISAIFPSVSF